MVSDLILKDGSRIVFAFPEDWYYEPDDVLICLIKDDLKIQLLHDSYNYFVLQETKFSVEKFRNQTTEYLKSKGYAIANRLFRACFYLDEDVELDHHFLFGYRNFCAYLSAADNGDAEITIVKVEVNDDENLWCETVLISTVDRNLFLKWADELLSLNIKINPSGSITIHR